MPNLGYAANEVRFVKYRSKYQNENKIVDILTLASCRSVLLLHSKRANYVACVWKRSLETEFEIPSISDHERKREHMLD